MAYPDIPKLSLPIRLNGSSLAAVEQDSEADILQCVEVLLRYPVGFRDDLPEFGIEDPTFTEGGVDVDALIAAVREWEPRADLEMEIDDARLHELIDHILIRLRGSTSG